MGCAPRFLQPGPPLQHRGLTPTESSQVTNRLQQQSPNRTKYPIESISPTIGKSLHEAACSQLLAEEGRGLPLRKGPLGWGDRQAAVRHWAEGRTRLLGRICLTTILIVL